MKPIRIGNFEISGNPPAFIIAELSANHNHKFDLAIKTIVAAKKAGADAIKFQTYTADTITIKCRSPLFMIEHDSLWDGKYLYDLYKEAYTPWEWQPKLMKYAESIGLVCFSSPFDFSAVDFLEKMNVPAYKIASLEINDLPLIRYVAAKNKPVIISTGVANLEDIELAIQACKDANNRQIILLKCTSEYPTPFDEVNLKTIPDMIEKFQIPVGLSDHTLGYEVALGAVALGSCIVEKHFILDRSLGGPDAAFSMNPEEFKNMVNSIRNLEKAIGKATYELTPKQYKSREHARSLFVVKNIYKDEVLTNENIRSIRPGYGIPPKYLSQVIGKKAKRNLKKGEPLSFDMF